jgi:hypothetical protein
MMKHGGIPTEDSYGPYMGQDGYCHLNESTIGLKIKNFVNVTSGGNKMFACTLHQVSRIRYLALRTVLATFSGLYIESFCHWGNNWDPY